MKRQTGIADFIRDAYATVNLWFDRFTVRTILPVLSDRYSRSLVIFWMLVGVLFIMLIQMLIGLRYERTAFRSTMCTKCNLKQEVLTNEIAGYHCRRCGNQLGYSLKCHHCQFEFPYLPRPVPEGATRSEIIKIKIEEKQCPNCGSYETYGLSAKKNRELERLLEQEKKYKF